MQFRKAKQSEAEAVFALYRAVADTPGCAWDEEYPGMRQVLEDLARDGLYVVEQEGHIVAAAAAFGHEGFEDDADEDDYLNAPCWDARIQRPLSVARLGVAREMQNQGLAGRLLLHIEREAVSAGYDGICFVVDLENRAAQAAYEAVGYRICGQTRFIGEDWLCYEKVLA